MDNALPALEIKLQYHKSHYYEDSHIVLNF